MKPCTCSGLALEKREFCTFLQLDIMHSRPTHEGANIRTQKYAGPRFWSSPVRMTYYDFRTRLGGSSGGAMVFG